MATLATHDPAPADAGTVFLLDVDDTPLDNDRFRDDLSARLERDFGRAGRDRYWSIHDLHKQRMLASVQRRYPAAHYAMVDDKPGLPAQMKQILGARLTTEFVRQGHYAAADIRIDRIGDLCRLGTADFRPAAAPRFALVDHP